MIFNWAACHCGI